METKNVLIGAGAGAAAAAAWLWYKKSQEGKIPTGSNADEYVPPAVTQDYSMISKIQEREEKAEQIKHVADKIQALVAQRQQQEEAQQTALTDTPKEEEKAGIVQAKQDTLDYQREQTAHGRHSLADMEEDTREAIGKPKLPENAIVVALARLAAIRDKGKRAAAAKVFAAEFKKYPYPERRAATKHAQSWFAALPFQRKQQVIGLLNSIGLGPVMLSMWKKAQEAQQDKEAKQGFESQIASQSTLAKEPPKELPQNALVVAIARLEKITDANTRKLRAQQFAASLKGYTQASKQRAMRFANSWFMKQPFAVKKRVVNVMLSIGMGENIRLAWEAAQKEQQQKDAKTQSQQILEARSSTDRLAEQTRQDVADKQAIEERARITAERQEQEKTRTEYIADQRRTAALTQKPPMISSNAETRAMEMRAFQGLINLTMKFPTMTEAQQKMVVRTMPMQLARLPKESQTRVKALYLAWFRRRPQEFQAKVRGMLANLR